jgi:hypothetical protein
MKKIFLVLSSVLITCNIGFTQKVLMEKNIKDNAYSMKKGPNMKYFSHIFIGYELFAGPPDKKGAEIVYGSSASLDIGYRHKFKILEFYSIGFSTEYSFNKYIIRQTENKLLPNTLEHDKEKLRFNNARLEFYNRFNFDKRGNTLGKFFDIGLYGDWTFATNHYTRDKAHDAANMSEVTVTKYTRLQYTTNFNYGLSVRFGLNKISLSANYRLSDLFNEEYQLPELPGFSVGLELALYGN